MEGSVKVNGIVCKGWRDTVYRILLVKESLVREGDSLPGKNLNILALAEFHVIVPWAKIYLECENVKGDIVVGSRNFTSR